MGYCILYVEYNNRLALPGDVSSSGWTKATQTLTPHTFRPWQYRRIWREMPLSHIGPTSRNTFFMVHLSKRGLKTGTRAVTARHRAKRRRGGITWRHVVGISALLCRKKPEILWVSRLNQRIPLPDAGKCLNTVGLGRISFIWRHKFFWNAGKSYSKNRDLQHNKFRLCHPEVFSFSAVF